MVTDSGEQQRLHPQRLGGQRALHLLTAALVSLVARVTQAVSDLVDAPVPCARGVREVQDSGSEVTGAGIWVLMAREGAGLCRAMYIPRAEHSDQTHPCIKPQVPGGGRVCVGVAGCVCPHLGSAGAHRITTWVWTSPLVAALLPPGAPFPGAKHNRLGWPGEVVLQEAGKVAGSWAGPGSGEWPSAAPGALLGSHGQECVVRMKPEEESENRRDKNWAEAREGEERGSL